jgi:hypothetical protein
MPLCWLRASEIKSWAIRPRRAVYVVPSGTRFLLPDLPRINVLGYLMSPLRGLGRVACGAGFYRRVKIKSKVKIKGSGQSLP